MEVSQKIKEEFENGRDYYALHGKKLVVIPSAPNDQPSLSYSGGIMRTFISVDQMEM